MPGRRTSRGGRTARKPSLSATFKMLLAFFSTSGPRVRLSATQCGSMRLNATQCDLATADPLHDVADAILRDKLERHIDAELHVQGHRARGCNMEQ